MVQVDFATLYGLLHNRKSPIFMYDDGTVSLQPDLSKNQIGCWADIILADHESCDICLRLDKRLSENVFPLYVDSDWCISQQKPEGSIIGKIWAPLSQNPENIEVEPQVGWYAFAGNKFSPLPDKYENLQGVVAYKNPYNNHGLILLLEEQKRIWSRDETFFGVDSEADGYGNTRELVNYAKLRRVYFNAVEWCYWYERRGIKAKEAFLPATSQWMKIFDNEDKINRALNAIGAAPLAYRYWTSCEQNSKFAWYVMKDNQEAFVMSKSAVMSVRAVKAF